MGGSGLDRTDDFQKICGSGLDRIKFYWIGTRLGLKIFTVRSSLHIENISFAYGAVDDEMDADFAHLT